MKITIESTERPDAEQHAFIEEQLRLFNLNYAPDDQHILLDLYARNEQGEMVAGLLGGTFWGWLHIDTLWVRQDARGQGLGARLMAQAEEEALRRGCHHATVMTMDFQAPEFYEKLGYTLWGVLDDLPTGRRRLHYQKRLG